MASLPNLHWDFCNLMYIANDLEFGLSNGSGPVCLWQEIIQDGKIKTELLRTEKRFLQAREMGFETRNVGQTRITRYTHGAWAGSSWLNFTHPTMNGKELNTLDTLRWSYEEEKNPNHSLLEKMIKRLEKWNCWERGKKFWCAGTWNSMQNIKNHVREQPNR